MYIELDALSANQRYFTMIQSLLPRPIAWVLSDNGNDSLNLAPFSYFNAICSEPPLLMLSIGRKPNDDKKDSIVNILERKNFVVNIPCWAQAEAVTETSRTLAHGELELDRVDLSLTNFDGFALPRVEGCRIAYACDLYQVQEVGNVPQTLIFGQVSKVYVDDAAGQMDDKGRLSIDAMAVDPLSRLGGNEYGRLGEVRTVPRPQ